MRTPVGDDIELGGASAIVNVERSAVALLAALVREPLTSVPEQAYDAGMVVTRALGRMRVYLTGPELVQEAFVRQADALTKSEQGRVLKPALGTGLLTAEGSDWRWQRRTLSPGFAHARLQSLVPAMIAAAEAMRDVLLALQPDSVVDIGRETTRVTLRIVGDPHPPPAHCAAKSPAPSRCGGPEAAARGKTTCWRCCSPHAIRTAAVRSPTKRSPTTSSPSSPRDTRRPRWR